MENNNPVEPLQNPGEQSQPSVLDRVFHRAGLAEGEQPANPVTDNVQSDSLTKCINPSCTVTGSKLGDDGVCTTCGFNQGVRY